MLEPADVLTPAEILEGRTRFETVSGLYRNTRQDDDLWFAYRRSADWALFETRSKSDGGLYIEQGGARRALLIVRGAVAVQTDQHAPGHRRLQAMVQHGVTWPGPPGSTTTTVWEGREALACRWHDEVEREAIFDLETGLPVRTEWPGEVVELTELCFDMQVDQTVFDPPDQAITGWRGGIAFIVRSGGSGEIASSWEPRSGPAGLHIPGPQTTSLDEAMRWAQERTDEIQISDAGERP